MTDSAVTAKLLADLARKHIADQQNRIVRQRELMAKYERAMMQRGYQKRAASLRGCKSNLP